MDKPNEILTTGDGAPRSGLGEDGGAVTPDQNAAWRSTHEGTRRPASDMNALRPSEEG